MFKTSSQINHENCHHEIGLQQDVKAVLFRHKSKCPFGCLNRKTNNKIYYIFLATFFFLFSFSHQKEENKIPQGCEKCNSLLGSKQRTMDDSEAKTSKGISVKQTTISLFECSICALFSFLFYSLGPLSAHFYNDLVTIHHYNLSFFVHEHVLQYTYFSFLSRNNTHSMTLYQGSSANLGLQDKTASATVRKILS